MSKNNVYRLQGLSCANCAAKFEKNIRSIDTVANAHVNFGAAKVSVEGDVTIQQLEKAGAFDNIKVYPETESVQQETSFFKRKENIFVLISSVFLLAGIIMQMSIGKESPFTIGAYLAAIAIGGFHLFIAGFKNLFRFYFDMKTLMTIAIIGAAIIGEWMEGAIVVLLFAISEALESYSINKARKSLQALIDIAPKNASIRRGDNIVQLHVDDIEVDDIMIIKPGEKIAMDGEIISGTSAVNQAAITGESIPVTKHTDDEVFAGTINGEGSLEIRVSKLAKDTTLAKIVHLVEEAQAEKAPAQHFVDRFATYYTPAIMIIALLVATIPPLLFGADWSHFIYLGLATLVVGCPCALVVSTPVAIITAIGTAARHGVLIKGGVHLEETGRIQAIAFDKTGTLTNGMPAVTDIITLSETPEEETLKIASAIEAYSQHPIASAILRETKKRDISSYKAEQFQSLTGKGATAIVNGDRYFIGNDKLFVEEFSFSSNVEEQMNTLQTAGKTAMILGTKEEAIAIIAVADKVREKSRTVVEKLKALGIKHTFMLTGDNERTAKKIANEVGIENVKANLLPEEKLSIIEEIQSEHEHVAMVGDGINDAPALANANVGIAMGGAGTDVALETAHVTLMEDDLGKLPFTISLSRRAVSIIKQNISFALGLKIIALLLLIPGWLTLWIAIIADVGATLLVVFNAMRLMDSNFK